MNVLENTSMENTSMENTSMENTSMENTSKEAKEAINNICTINHIRCLDETEPDIEASLASSAFLTGYIGLIFALEFIENGLQPIAYAGNEPAYITLGIAGTALIASIGAYIKDKIASHKAIKQIRENTGMTVEKQREVLTQLVIGGDTSANDLFDYFYGEKKRKSL